MPVAVVISVTVTDTEVTVTAEEAAVVSAEGLSVLADEVLLTEAVSAGAVVC